MIRSAKSRNADRLPVRAGLLVIGDPHVEGRQPGFRRDDYPEVILEKIRWCLDHAVENNLQPVFLGDMFEKPRDNSNWIIARLIEIMQGSGAIGIYGNHDCAEISLTENDSLMLLIKAGCLKLVSQSAPWVGEIDGQVVVVGGSSYREAIPHHFDTSAIPRQTLFDEPPRVVWITHHDIDLPGYPNGRVKPRAITNVDLLINGHIHRRMDDVKVGNTVWTTPGNISRRSRSDSNREHEPAVMRVGIHQTELAWEYVTVPHEPASVVFHPAVTVEHTEHTASEFITGLKEMKSRKTESGAGLIEFLSQNVAQFEEHVAEEIMLLAKEIDDE